LLVAVLVEVDLTVQMVVVVLVVFTQDLQQEVLLLIRLLLVVVVVPTHLVQTLCSIVIDQPVGVKDLIGTMQTVMGPTFQVDLVVVPPMIHLDLQVDQETNIPQHHPRSLEMLLDKEILVVRVEIWQEMGLSLAVEAVVVPVVAVVTLAPVDRVQVVLDHQTFIKLDLQFFMLVAAVVDLNLMVLQVIWVVLQDQVAVVLDQIVVLDQQEPQILEVEEVERMLAADQDLVVREL
jgi:hypothetical protein